MRLTLAEAKELYKYRRESMLAAVEARARTIGYCDGFRATTISAITLQAWRSQWRGGRFNWVAEEEDFREFNRFEIALWCGDRLCGLALGLPRGRKKRIMGVARMEGNPDPGHPLKSKVTGLVLAAATEYGKILNSRVVRFYDPDPGVTWWYEEELMHCVPPDGDLLGYCEIAI